MGALPIPEKTWQWSTNVVLDGYTYNTTQAWHRQALLLLKAAITGFASSPWTLVSSSNGTTASNADNWGATASNLNWANAGSAHSWIVFQQDGMKSGVQLCFDLVTTSTQNITIAFSPSVGFTGGTTTARPTASDESVLISATTWIGGRTSNFSKAHMHFLQPTDGSAFAFLFADAGGGTGGQINAAILAWQVQEAVNGLTNNVLAAAVSASAGNNVLSIANFHNPTASFKGYQGATMTAFCSASGIINLTLANSNILAPNARTSRWPLYPVGLASITSGKAGLYGRLHDIYWGSTYHQPGTPYTYDGTYWWIQFGSFVFPWNGDTPRFS